MLRRSFLRSLAALPFVGVFAQLTEQHASGAVEPVDELRTELSDTFGAKTPEGYLKFIKLTKPEMMLWKAIKHIPDCRHCFGQFSCLEGGIARHFDFAFPALKKAIEVDMVVSNGNLPRRIVYSQNVFRGEKGHVKLVGTMTADTPEGSFYPYVDGGLYDYGWRVMHISHEAIENDLTNTITRIVEFLKHQRK